MPDPADARLRGSFVATLGAGAALAAAALVLRGARDAGSVAVGAIVAAVNLLALGRILRALTTPDGTRVPGLWGALLGLKIAALFGGTWALLASGRMGALPLVIGTMALPAGAVIAALVADARERPPSA